MQSLLVKMMNFLILLLCYITINDVEGGRYRRLTTLDMATPEEFPYMVSIQYRGNHRCGGALLPSYRHILTAAHCVHVEGKKDFLPEELSVIVGSVNYTNPNIGVAIGVEHIGYHPGFTFYPVFPQNATNDIAVLRLAESILQHRTIKPVTLPTTMYEEYDGARQLIITGFGAEWTRGAPSLFLRMMIVLQVNTHSCQKVYHHRKLDDSDMCALSVENFDACPGDSGGPLVLRRGGVVVGVLSEGPVDGCGTGNPNVYTKVSYHLNFIQSEMRKPKEDVL